MVRVRFGPGDIKSVDVRDGKCPGLACFWPTRHTVHAAAGASGCSSRVLNTWECGRREQHGCPPVVREVRLYRRVHGVWEERHGR